MGDPRIAVGVITRDRRDELLATLRRLEALPESPPVVVVDNGSSDGTPAAVRAAHPGVELIALEANLAAAGRNVAARVALADGARYVAFSDDDSWWAPGALTTAADILDAHPRLALLQGRILVGAEERLDPVCAEMASSPLPRGPRSAGPALLGFVACGTVVRAGAFLDAGGFAAPLGVGGEETLLAVDLAAAGWELAYVDAVIAHHHPSRVRDPAARRRRVAVNELWTALHRRPAPVVAATARGVARRPRAALQAVAGLPWSLSGRRPLPQAVENGLVRLGS